MGNLFGKKKETKVTSRDRVMLDLKVQRDKLNKYKKRMAEVVAREVEIAKELLRKGDKKNAGLALKKKKFQEGLVAKADGTLLNIQQQIETIEFTLIEHDVLKNLQAGNDVLKQLNNEMTIEDVEKILDDTHEAIEYQREIDELLAGELTAEDNQEVLAELAALEAENLDLPDAPTTVHVEPKQVVVEEKGPAKQKGAARQLVAA